MKINNENNNKKKNEKTVIALKSACNPCSVCKKKDYMDYYSKVCNCNTRMHERCLRQLLKRTVSLSELKKKKLKDGSQTNGYYKYNTKICCDTCKEPYLYQPRLNFRWDVIAIFCLVFFAVSLTFYVAVFNMICSPSWESDELTQATLRKVYGKMGIVISLMQVPLVMFAFFTSPQKVIKKYGVEHMILVRKNKKNKKNKKIINNKNGN